MNAPTEPRPGSLPPTAVFTFVVVTAILYFGREVLIPLGLAVLLSFLLAPAVRYLERLRLPRVVATTLVALLSFGVLAGVVWVTGTQALNLAASLPEYKTNIQAKIRGLRSAPEGSIGKATQTIKEIGKEITNEQIAEKASPASPPTTARPQASRPEERPVPVIVEPPPLGPIEFIKDFSGPLIAPFTTAAAAIIFTFVMLLQREDLRDRLIRLVGRQDLNVTTQVFEEAGDRVSRYLRMQLIVNASYGVPVGVALYAIGIPNAPLWGVLATALRFIPYLGPLIAAALPIGVAFALSDGWSLVLWTLGVFVVLEVITNNIIEPWLYGSSTGLSTLGILVAAIFWTWLWGPVGLLLSTPLTVCLVVIGRYVPRLAILNVLLGDEPVLRPSDRFYQRLLALDQEEASDLADDYVDEHGVEALYEQVLIPAIDLAERDRHKDALTEERKRFVFEMTRRLIEDMNDRPTASGPDISAKEAKAARADRSAPAQPVLCILPAHDEADELVGLMLLEVANAHGIAGTAFGTGMLASEAIERMTEHKPEVVCISAMPPIALLHATALCKRLHKALPDMAIVVALWHAQGNIERATTRLESAGASGVVTTLDATVTFLRSRIVINA